MSKPLQAQVLRLEDAFEETRRAGTVLGDELKYAIMLRCITGVLKTHFSLHLNENCTYPELREEVLRWERAHQKWNNLLQFSHYTTGGSNNNDTVPMEVDRIEGRGRGKGGKGKSKTDKGNAKGKSKSKRKDKGKGKNSSYDGGGKSGKGKSVPNQGKKGGKGDKSCYVCGKWGHYARDCCRNQSVRNVQNVSHGGQGQPDQGQNSSQHSGQQPQTQQSPPNRATQYRVSRISELNEHAEADQEQFVFDLRLSVPTSPNSNVSSVRALRFYLGDDEDEVSNQHGDVRAVVTEMPDEGDMQSILVDSGADAAVFPSTFARSGQKASGEVAKLHDAQGRIIPVENMRDVEVKLMDQNGKFINLFFAMVRCWKLDGELTLVSKHLSILPEWKYQLNFKTDPWLWRVG